MRLLQLDGLANLWVGDDPSDGAGNFQGRLWYISAGTSVEHWVVTEQDPIADI